MEVTFCATNGQEIADLGILISAPLGQTRVISGVPEYDSHPKILQRQVTLIGQEKVSSPPAIGSPSRPQCLRTKTFLLLAPVPHPTR
jgi:hypothetical protein